MLETATSAAGLSSPSAAAGHPVRTQRPPPRSRSPHVHVSGCAHDVVRDHAAQQLNDGLEGRLGRRGDLPIPAL